MPRLPLLLAALLLPVAAAAQQTGPQPVLPKEPLTITSRDGKVHRFDVEVATTPEQQETGLMFRPTVAADGGMLFDWGREQDSEMWMKNTLAPLDMVFIGRDGTIRRIAEDTVPRSLAVIGSGAPVEATLELQAGITRKLDIRAGDKVGAKQFGG